MAFLGVKGMSNEKDLKFRKKCGCGGFTLVEVCVVVAILAVLLSIGFVAIVKHQKELRVQEMDNLARAAYMAAENQALNLSRAGTLVKAIGDAEGTLIKPFTFKGGEYTSVADMVGEGFDADMLTETDRALAYVSAENVGTSRLMSKETVDPKISSGYVYLIYDLFSGTVVDAYYAEENISTDINNSWMKLSGMLPPPAPNDIKGILNAGWDTSVMKPKNNRSVAERASAGAFVGRYNGGTSADSADRKPAPDVAGKNVKVDIINDDSLYVKIEYPENSNLEIKISYKTAEINLTDADEKFVKSTDSSSKTITGTFILDGNPSTKDGKMIRFGSLKDAAGNSRWKNKDGNPIAEINNIISDMFTVEVKAVRSGYRDGDTIIKQGQPLFADGSTVDTAIVTNLRHLQNLDNKFSGTSGIASIVQKADINAKDNIDEDGNPVDKGNGYKFKPIYNNTARSYISVKKESGTEYCSITNLTIGENDEPGGPPGYYKGLFRAVEDGFKFTGVTVDGLKSHVTIKSEDLENAAYAGGLVGGAFRTSIHEGGIVSYEEGSVSFSDCVISNADVQSTNNKKEGIAVAGGMVSRANKAYFTSCVIDGDDFKVKSTTAAAAASDNLGNDKGISFAGGMAGRVTGELKVSDCHLVKAEVTSTGYRAIAGGLAGYSPANTEFTNCTIGGYKKSDNTDVVGKVKVDSSSGSDKQYYSKDIYAKYPVGTAEESKLWHDGDPILGGAGGMIGYAYGNTKLDKCTAAGEIEIIGQGVSDQAGGLIGICVPNTTTDSFEGLKDCAIQKAGGKNPKVTAGDGTTNTGGNAGGMIGYAYVSIDKNGNPISYKMTNCVADGVIVEKKNASDYACVGGLVGCAGKVILNDSGSSFETNASGNTELSGCSVTGDSKVTGKGFGNRVGGIIGYAAHAKMTNCNVNINDTSEASISGTYEGSASADTIFAGGIVGRADGTEFSGCNVGNVYIKAGAYGNAGGIAGRADSTKFLSCNANSVRVEAGNGAASTGGSAGGIAGRADGTEFSSCNANNVHVEANVNGAAPGADGYAGGIAGRTSNTNFSSCRVYWDQDKLPYVESGDTRSVPSQIIGYYAGGLAGGVTGGLPSWLDSGRKTVEDSFAATFVKGDNSGGLLGSASGTSAISIERSYADSVLNGNVKGGLVGNNTCNGLSMSNVYAVLEDANYSSTLKLAGFCVNNRSEKVSVTDAYANFYGTGMDGISTANLPKLIDGAQNLVGCFWMFGTEGYKAKDNGDFDSEVGREAAKNTLNHDNIEGEFSGPNGTYPYQMTGHYPYPGLKNLPHYGDWGTGSIADAKITNTAKKLFGIDVRALKKNGNEFANDALAKINDKLKPSAPSTHLTFKYKDGKTYNFISATRLQFSKKADGITDDYSTASLFFKAQVADGSSGETEIELVDGLRTEASLEMTKTMLTSNERFTEEVRRNGSDDDFKRALINKVKDKMNEKTSDNWSDYSYEMFDEIEMPNAELTMDTNDLSRLTFKFTLKKKTDSMEPGASEIIQISFKRSVFDAIRVMEENTAWTSKANVKKIKAETDNTGDEYNEDSLNGFAEEATEWLASHGFRDKGYEVKTTDETLFHTSANKEYAEAKFKLFKDKKVYKDGDKDAILTLKTRRSAAPGVVLDYLKSFNIDNKWTLNDGSKVLIYAMRQDGKLSLNTKPIPKESDMTVCKQDEKDFKDAVEEVMKTLNERGFGKYTLTFNSPQALPQTILQIENVTEGDATKRERAFINVTVNKLKKDGNNSDVVDVSSNPGDLEAKIFELTGVFETDAAKLLTHNRHEPLILIKEYLPTFEDWAKGRLRRIGYDITAAQVTKITLNKGDNGVVTAGVDMTLAGTDGTAAVGSGITVNTPVHNFAAVAAESYKPRLTIIDAPEQLSRDVVEPYVKNKINEIITENRLARDRVAVKKVEPLPDNRLGCLVTFGPVEPLIPGADGNDIVVEKPGSGGSVSQNYKLVSLDYTIEIPYRNAFTKN